MVHGIFAENSLDSWKLKDEFQQTLYELGLWNYIVLQIVECEFEENLSCDFHVLKICDY